MIGPRPFLFAGYLHQTLLNFLISHRISYLESSKHDFHFQFDPRFIPNIYEITDSTCSQRCIASESHGLCVRVRWQWPAKLQSGMLQSGTSAHLPCLCACGLVMECMGFGVVYMGDYGSLNELLRKSNWTSKWTSNPGNCDQLQDPSHLVAKGTAQQHTIFFQKRNVSLKQQLTCKCSHWPMLSFVATPAQTIFAVARVK